MPAYGHDHMGWGQGVEDVCGLKNVLAQVDGTLQVFHYHCSCVQAIVRASVCWEDEPYDCVPCNLCLHLSRGSNHCSCTFCEFHIIGGVRIFVDVRPCRVSDACERASRVNHCLSCNILRVMEFHWYEP